MVIPVVAGQDIQQDEHRGWSCAQPAAFSSSETFLFQGAMGNTMSVLEEAEDNNACTVKSYQEIDDCNRKDLRQDSAGVHGLAAEQPDKAEVKQDNPQPVAAVDNSVMSFLKTLRTEQQPVTSVKSDKNVPSSQEPQTTKQNTKAPEPAAQQQAAATEAPKEGTKEKASSTPTPLSKLFWKKNASEEAEIVSNEKADTSLEAAAPDKDESKSPEAAEVKPRREESKTPKANLRKFFKLTLNSTERPLVPAESEPVGQKSKESSKAKKPAAELSKQKGSKQEAREQPDSREQPAAETDSIHNGGDASKEPSFKKTEKRQSLGGFFKGLVR
ncbi:breast carcinoma-amplified sequence 1 [Grus japonensis]|uniref:Breast carcinoma-amplified sequence 1 n=1 Tax=Grus japonensis TaxID=30415 RepID=A0ABC9XK80_GRUJA